MFPLKNGVWCSERWSPFATRNKVGGKAQNLYRLKRAGHNVPRWLVVSTDVFEEANATINQEIQCLLDSIDFNNSESVTEASARIGKLYREVTFPEETKERLQTLLKSYFADGTALAVRSSVVDEDSVTDSFAGQMDSFLNTPPEQVLETIKEVWASAYSARSLCYRHHKGLNFRSIKTAVIIQEMVQSARAGVMFTSDPQTKNQTCVISAAWGLGEGVVNGNADTDTYRINCNSNQISRIPRGKEHLILSNGNSNGNGSSNSNGHKTNSNGHQNGFILKDKEVRRLSAVGRKIEHYFRRPQDIEWAFDCRGHLFILQSRPIVFNSQQAEQSNVTVWDNSNIVESYPGLTLPLTFSFIRQCYEISFRKATMGFLIKRKELNKHLHIFGNMIGLLNGRVYYNLLNWYRMLSFLPGFKKHKVAWDQMIGISKKEAYAPNRLSIINKVYALLMVIFRLLTVRLNARKFFKNFDRIYYETRQLDFNSKTEEQLIADYDYLRTQYSKKWHLTLYNDFCAMKYYDWLKRMCQKWIPKSGVNLHNDLLCGENEIESVQPISALLTITAQVKENHAFQLLFEDANDDRVWSKIHTEPQYKSLKTALQNYLDRFGDRGLEELKLENSTFREKPESLISLIREYSRRNLKLADLHKNERHIRETAEQIVHRQLKWSWRQPLFWFVLANARRAIANRENMRFARTRLFGIVRRLFRRMAERMVSLGVLRSEEDLYYLTVPEIFDYIRGASVTCHLQAVAELRRYEYEQFAKEQPDNKIITSGIPYLQPLTTVKETTSGPQQLQGIGCASGIAEGTAWVVTDPAELPPYDDCILVARSTDPGWIFLMIQSRGIVVEKGSLLSHTAIVGRELGIPTVVGVEGATSTIRQGSRIRINGETGQVTCR